LAPYTKDFGIETRWGDYSATMVDPINDLSFWTLQEYAATPGTESQWGTWWAFMDLAVPPDGILEVTVNPTAGSFVVAGTGTNVFVRVSDVFPVTNAIVQATVSGGGSLDFRNDGTGPDARALDNIYSATLPVPLDQKQVNVNFSISAAGKQSTNFTV